VLAVLFYLYGNNSTHFDSIYIGALCLSCLFCWGDKDTLGALLILLGYWLFAKAIINIPDLWQSWVLIYGVSAALCIYYFRHITAKITFLIVLYTVAAELIWWFQDYLNKPRIYYYVGLLAITVWVRQLLFDRIFIADRYFNYTSGKTGLDTHIGSILYLYFILVLLMTAEYFLRHQSGLNVTTVYYLYTPISNVISGITLAAVYMHYFNNQSKKYLSA
jgi:hypothetical protein